MAIVKENRLLYVVVSLIAVAPALRHRDLVAIPPTVLRPNLGTLLNLPHRVTLRVDTHPITALRVDTHRAAAVEKNGGGESDFYREAAGPHLHLTEEVSGNTPEAAALQENHNDPAAAVEKNGGGESDLDREAAAPHLHLTEEVSGNTPEAAAVQENLYNPVSKKVKKEAKGVLFHLKWNQPEPPWMKVTGDATWKGRFYLSSILRKGGAKPETVGVTAPAQHTAAKDDSTWGELEAILLGIETALYRFPYESNLWIESDNTEAIRLVKMTFRGEQPTSVADAAYHRLLLRLKEKLRGKTMQVSHIYREANWPADKLAEIKAGDTRLIIYDESELEKIPSVQKHLQRDAEGKSTPRFFREGEHPILDAGEMFYL